MNTTSKEIHIPTNLHITNLNVSQSSHHTHHTVVEKPKKKDSSFFVILYIFFTIANTLLASYLVFKMQTILIQTENFEVLYYLVMYITQWIITSFITVLLYILVLMMRKILRIKSNQSDTKEHFFTIVRLIIAVMSLILIVTGFYFLVKLTKNDSKQYKLNFHENYMLLYIFLVFVILISSVVAVVAIYYIAIIYLRLNRKKIEIDEVFIQNVKDELNLNHKKLSTFIPPSQDFIQNNDYLSQQINKMKILTVNSEDDKTRKFNNLNFDNSQEKDIDLKKSIENEKKKIKKDIFDFTLSKEKKKENLMDEIKKEMKHSNSPEKFSNFTDLKNENTTITRPYLASVDTFKV